jgi:hypothetical protein
LLSCVRHSMPPRSRRRAARRAQAGYGVIAQSPHRPGAAQTGLSAHRSPAVRRRGFGEGQDRVDDRFQPGSGVDDLHPARPHPRLVARQPALQQGAAVAAAAEVVVPGRLIEAATASWPRRSPARSRGRNGGKNPVSLLAFAHTYNVRPAAARISSSRTGSHSHRCRASHPRTAGGRRADDPPGTVDPPGQGFIGVRVDRQPAAAGELGGHCGLPRPGTSRDQHGSHGEHGRTGAGRRATQLPGLRRWRAPCATEYAVAAWLTAPMSAWPWRCPGRWRCMPLSRWVPPLNCPVIRSERKSR